MSRIMDPWIGDNYATTGLKGRKILVMGESSYKPEGYPPEYDLSAHNKNLALDAIGWDEGRGYWNKSKFFTRIARMLGFEARSYEERHKFWHSVAYYNFLQIILKTARQMPPAAAWDDATGPLYTTLQELKPDILLSFSNRMWWRLPKHEESDITNKEGVFAKKAIIKCPNGQSIPVLGFNHPTSRGFVWRNVGAVLSRQLT